MLRQNVIPLCGLKIYFCDSIHSAMLAFIVFSFLPLSSAFMFGNPSGGDSIVHIRKFGFDEDPKTFSHEVVAPWIRPFKPGYCESWEWHTDKRYRDERIRICKELSGGKLLSNSDVLYIYIYWDTHFSYKKLLHKKLVLEQSIG